jgi:hypothetical protein
MDAAGFCPRGSESKHRASQKALAQIAARIAKPLGGYMKRWSMAPHEMEHVALVFIRVMMVAAILATIVGALA